MQILTYISGKLRFKAYISTKSGSDVVSNGEKIGSYWN